jgi:hypothetical protein
MLANGTAISASAFSGEAMEPNIEEQAGEAATVAAVFADPNDAHRAMEELRARGFSAEEIGVAARGGDATDDGAMDNLEETEEIAGDVATGAVEGGLLGAALGLFVGAFLVPGVGPIVAGGALASALSAAGSAALAGVGLGAATGGILGVLRAEGFTENHAARLADRVHEGGILVTVNSGRNVEEARAILTGHGGEE